MKKYQEIIDGNVNYLKKLKNIEKDFDIKQYKEPDGIIEIENINGIEIKISTDGFCSIKKIIQFSKSNEDIISNYKSLRENKYLRWPAYALSINQQRGFKTTFDDRIDLLLLDIKTLYRIFEESQKQDFLISYEQIKHIKDKCKLAYAYLNIHTLIWLKNFKSFDGFVKKNELKRFCKYDGIHYSVERWSESEVFDEKYFKELIKKCSERSKQEN